MSLTAICSSICDATSSGRFSLSPGPAPAVRGRPSKQPGSGRRSRRGSSLPTLRKRGPAVIRRFTRAVRAAEIFVAVIAVAVLAILFLPRLTGGGNAAAPAIEQPDLNVAVVPAVDSAGFFVA